MEERYIVAVEIGSSKIKGALGFIDQTGILNVIAVQEERLTGSVRYGQIRNVEEVSNKIDAICSKLENSKPVMPRKITGVYVGLSGSTVASSAVEVLSSLPGEVEVTSQTIQELKEKASASVLSGKDIYEIVPKEYFVDNMSTQNPVGTFGSAVKGRFTVISGAPGIKSNIERVFPERLQLQVCGYVVSATAQADAVLTEDEKRLGSMFVDFGAETTTVLLYKSGVLQYMATLPIGSRNITRDLVSLNYLEERAEAIKRSVGVASAGDGVSHAAHPEIIDQPEINNYIQARAGEIVANVLAQIEYAGLKASDLPAGIVIVGGGARLRGFSDMLASQSKMKVRMGMSPRGVRISDTAIQADDAVDVIALLCHVANGDAQDCLSAVQPSAAASASGGQEEVRREDRYEDRYEDQGSDVRIGIDDDEDVLEDDDDDKWVKKNRNRKGGRQSASKGPSIMERIRDKLAVILKDSEDDRYEDDDAQQEDDQR